ncbi:hypothetical protein D3C83_268580 [compost metagenome]
MVEAVAWRRRRALAALVAWCRIDRVVDIGQAVEPARQIMQAVGDEMDHAFLALQAAFNQ